MPLSFALESPNNGKIVEYGYCVVYNGLGRCRGCLHGENMAKVRGHLAITQSGHEASDVTLADRYLIS
jgi:hypothetical protein